MPDLDFAILADYVRTHGGFGYLIAGGIDTIYAPEIPTGQNLGLLVRVAFTHAECGRPHSVEIIMQDVDGRRLVQISGTTTADME